MATSVHDPNETALDGNMHGREVDEAPDAMASELKEFYERHNIKGVEEFLRRLPLEKYDSSTNAPPPVRFIRLNPRFNKTETLSGLEAELPDGSPLPTPIPWLDPRLGFFALPGNFNLAQSQQFRSGRIYGMDVSSGAAVAALLTNQYDCSNVARVGKDSSETDKPFVVLPRRDPCPTSSERKESFRVLDLCCAPGLKLCAIADLLSDSRIPSAVVGVDVSKPRAALCKNIVKKYHIDPDTSGRIPMHPTNRPSTGSKDNIIEGCIRMRVYREDGTVFGANAKEHELIFDSQVAVEESQSAGKRKRMNKSARSRERKRLRQLSSLEVVHSDDKVVGSAKIRNINDSDCPIMMKLFDRVLVDAECSTDGSLKHVQQRVIKERIKAKSRKYQSVQLGASSSPVARNDMLTDQARLKELVDLQQRLISSGFRLLKPGGEMVYSTCSLSQEQNEGVVTWLLEKYPTDASIVPVSFTDSSDSKKEMISQGSIPGTVRFHPSTISTRDTTNGFLDENSLYGGGFFLAKIIKGNVAPEASCR